MIDGGTRQTGRTTAIPSGPGGSHDPAGVPGKQTLTQSLPGGPPGGGAPLPGAVRQQMERSFGADFAGVRVHHGGQADALGAEAYTQGNDVTFASGRFDASSTAGLALIGHELAHVVQQRDGRVASGQARGAAIDPDPALEVEAEAAGARAAAGQPAGIPVAGTGPGVERAFAPIQRKARWDDGSAQIVKLDMAEVVHQKETTGNARVGFCEPTVNGARATRVRPLEDLFAPPQITWTGDTPDTSDEPTTEHPTTSEPKTDAPTTDEHRFSGAKTRAQSPEIETDKKVKRVKTEAPKTDSPNSNAPTTDGPGTSEPTISTPSHSPETSQPTRTGGPVTAHVDAPGNNLGSYYMEVPDRSQHRWTKQITGEHARTLRNFAQFQNGFEFGETVAIVVEDTSGETSAKTELHEKVHREDHRRAFNSLVVPWNDQVDAQVGKTFTGPTREDVEAQLYHGQPRALIAKTFIDASLQSARAWHDHPDGKEAHPDLVEVTATRIVIRLKDNTPHLDEHVRDHYPELWDEVKHERGAGLERREKLKQEERAHREAEARAYAENRDKEPKTPAASAIKKVAEPLLAKLRSTGLGAVIGSSCGIGVVAEIVKQSSGDDEHPSFAGHSARYGVFILTQIKDELARLLSSSDAQSPEFLEMLKGKVAPHRGKLLIQSTTTTDSAPAIAALLVEIISLLPPP